MAGETARGTIDVPSDPGKPLQAAFGAALKRATSNIRGLVTLIGAIAGLVVAYYAFADRLKLAEPWPAVVCGGLIVVFVLLYVLPEFRDQTKLQRLRTEGIRGQLVDARYFRLAAYETDDAPSFSRSDSAAAEVCKWIVASSHSTLYLSGQSGVGKSSLINAAIVPSMSAAKWVVLTLRPHDSPLDEIAAALRRPLAIWQKPPSGSTALRTLIEQAAERVQRDGKRLLLVIDQFEEVLILCGKETIDALSSLLCDLRDRPIRGVRLLLSLSAEYLNDLPSLGLPPPAFGPGQNAFEVRPFSRAAAHAFMERSGLGLAPELLDTVLEEAAEIEDMPDRVRPIVLNMFGLVVASFTGSLPRGVRGGRLLSGYVERSLRSSASQGFAVSVLRPMVTDRGTKRTLTIEQVAEAAGVPPLVARGCLIHLANDGLVRPLLGAPEKWEVAHDFVARLLQPVLRSWRRSAWERSRPYVVPVPTAIWLLAMAGLIVFYPALHDEYVLSKLRVVGLVPAPSTEAGAAFVHNGTPIKAQADFWKVASLLQNFGSPIVSLDLSKARDLTSLQGMPALPALTSLNLSDARGLTSLQGTPALPALTSLDLSGADGLTSLQGMPALPALTSLDLSRANGLTSLQGMPALPALTSLDLGSTGLTSLQGMPALPALTSLDLGGTDLTSLQDMPALPALTSLGLTSATRLTSLQGMPALPALTSLNLSDAMGLTSLRGMPALPALTSLDLGRTGLTSLQGMPALPALTSLNLFNAAGLTSLRGMPALPALTSLILYYADGLTSLQGMPALPRLTTVDLRASGVKRLDFVPDLPALVAIKVSPGQVDPTGIPEAVAGKLVQSRDQRL